MDDNERRNVLISAISNGESRLAELDKERHKILAELESLKAELLILTNSSLDSTKDTPPSSDGIISKISSPEEKIALFGSLFRGRVDVYPRLWMSKKTGKKGFSPVCNNEWIDGICEKPKVKCSECSHRSFAPVTDSVIRGHLELLAEKLRPFVKNIITLKGGMRVKERKTIMESLTSIPDGEKRILLATGRYAGEGFDDARLDTLFLAMPVSWKGTLVQYAGRIHRLYDGKKEVRIYDYVDSNVPMLMHMFKKRLRGYRSLGYEIDGEL